MPMTTANWDENIIEYTKHFIHTTKNIMTKCNILKISLQYEIPQSSSTLSKVLMQISDWPFICKCRSRCCIFIQCNTWHSDRPTTMILILLIKVVHQPKIVRKFDQFWISFLRAFRQVAESNPNLKKLKSLCIPIEKA